MSLTWSPSATSLNLYREHSPVVFNDYPVSGHEGHMTECASPSEESGKNYQQERADTELLLDENKCFSFHQQHYWAGTAERAIKNINIGESTKTWEKMSLENHQFHNLSRQFLKIKWNIEVANQIKHVWASDSDAGLTLNWLNIS